MRTIFTTLAVVLLAAVATAETITTTTVNFGGIVNCQSITLSITRVSNGEVKTNIDFVIRECGYGETSPSVSKAYFNSPIPNGDFSTDRDGAHLNTTSPYGQIKIDWVITKDSRSSYDAVWTWTAPNNIRQSQNDDFRSVHAVGTIGSISIDRNGYFITSVFRK